MRYVTLQTCSLFISAGHSDTDPGAKGNGYTEADIVLELRDLVSDALRGRGVVFSKDGDRGQNLPLRQAVQMARTFDVAVEFHCNAFSSPSATGVETLSPSKHFPLCQEICTTISNVLGISNRGAKGESSGQHSRLAFIGDGGGVIIELFFISNPNDVRRYLDNKQELVEALADVLTEAVATTYGEE